MIIRPILEMRKQKFREGRGPSQGHVALKWHPKQTEARPVLPRAHACALHCGEGEPGASACTGPLLHLLVRCGCLTVTSEMDGLLPKASNSYSKCMGARKKALPLPSSGQVCVCVCVCVCARLFQEWSDLDL